jgi:hypothetical protein
MLNRYKKPGYCRIRIYSHYGFRFLAISTMLILALQTACFFKKKKSKASVVSLSSVRIVILPFNVPAGSRDLAWTAMAAPALIAKASRQNPDLTIVPLWEAMPPAIESAGASRTFTPESAISAANWLAADWAILGEISPAKSGVNMSIDFIPAKGNQIPFRYIKTRKVEMLEPCFYDAFRQFLRYLMVKLPEKQITSDQKFTLQKPLGESLDREYGWSVAADPGKAQADIADLMILDDRLARFLFNPSVYPALAEKK